MLAPAGGRLLKVCQALPLPLAQHCPSLCCRIALHCHREHQVDPSLLILHPH